MITAEQRIRVIILLEKMLKQKSYSEILGIEDISKFHGELMENKECEDIC